ncbi:MAG: PASTA domain-containing protein [Bacteroidales bacterium]|nr:PASTA domain-containing protein [Bacteroidales bacterium]
MNVLRKIINHYIFRNLVILFIICLMVYFGVLVILRHYTHHGEALAVPELRGLTMEEAQKVLSENKMRGQLVDSVYITSAKPGAVVGQDPEPKFKVKENRNVFLTINAITPEKVKMPDVVGISLRQAKSILELQGLNVGEIVYIPDIAKNNVLKQTYKGKEIRKGTEVIKGSEIDLVLGRGLSDERTEVPNLNGFSLSDARDYLTKYYLNFGVILYDESVLTSADSLKAFIYQQRPRADVGSTLQLGSSIDVWLTVDETKSPNYVEKEDGEETK